MQGDLPSSADRDATQWSSKSRKLRLSPFFPLSAGSQKTYIGSKGNTPRTNKKKELARIILNG